MIDWTPDEDQLRRFGWRVAIAFPLIGAGLAWLLPNADVLGIAVVFGFLTVTCGLLAWRAPGRLKPIYLLATFLGAIVLSPVLLIRRIFGGKAENLPDDEHPDSP